MTHWPHGQVLYNRVQPLGEPGHTSPTIHPHPFAASVTLMRRSAQKALAPFCVRQAPTPKFWKFRFECLWSLEKGRAGKGGLLSPLCFYCIYFHLSIFTLYFSESPTNSTFLQGMELCPSSLDHGFSLTGCVVGGMDGWMGGWVEIRLGEGFSSEIKCFLPPILDKKEKCCFLLSTFLKGNYRQETAIIYKCGKHENLRDLNCTFILPQ